MEPQTTIYQAGAVRDAKGVDARPGAVAVREGKVLAAGPPDEVRRQVGRGDQTIDLSERLLLPALVNAHAHLDLTAIGPRPYEGDFIKWIEMVMKLRPHTPMAIADAVHTGLTLSRCAGVGWLGDIAGSEIALQVRACAPPEEWIDGKSFLECFGFGQQGGEAASRAMERLLSISKEWNTSSRGGLVFELQPHAPYSAGLEVYQVAHNYWLGYPCTHLAETMDEDEFVRNATGPFADLLRRLGKWHEDIRANRQSPIQYLAGDLACSLWLAVHCNYADDRDIAVLRQAKTTVAYCPIASDYFGHRNHRYRDMLAAGVNVCLGTDSILCQPQTARQPLSILAEVRHLFLRDATKPQTLLEMATTRGIRGLVMDAHKDRPRATFQAGAPAKLISVRFDPADPTDPLTQVLRNDYPVEPILL